MASLAAHVPDSVCMYLYLYSEHEGMNRVQNMASLAARVPDYGSMGVNGSL